MATQDPTGTGGNIYYKKPEESIPEYTARTGFMNTPITGATLQGEAPVQLPPQPTEPNYGATLGSIGTLLNPAPSKEETNQTDFQKQILDLTQSIGGKEQYQAEQNQAFGVTETGNQLRDIQNQVQALNLEAAAIPSAIQEQFQGRGATAAGVAPIQTGVLRQNTLKSLGLAAQGMIIQGKYANAKDLADRAVAIKFAPEENKLKYLQAAYAMNKDSLERTDKKRAENLQVQLAERTRILDKQKSDYSAASALALAALKNNPNNEAAKIAANEVLKLDPASPDYMQKAFNLVGQYQKDPVAVQKALLENKKTQAEINKLNKETQLSGVPPITSPNAAKYSGALSVILGSGKFTKEQKADLVNAVNSGEDPFAVIKNQAKNTMGQTLATSLDKYETAKAQLVSIDTLLKDYYANGGRTGIITGNFEKAINSLGGITDPALVEISTNIAAALQIYRNAVSGTAYSVQEGQDIARIFPGINKTEGLNKAILSGRSKAFDTTIDAQYRNTLGSAYDSLKKASEQTSTPTTGMIKVRNLKTGAIQNYNGSLTPEEAKANGYEIIQ